MKQYIKYLSLAAIVVMGALIASCEKIELRIDPVVEDNIVVCTTTLNMGTAGTKALTAGGEKTFAVGEQIAVVYRNTSGVLVKAVSQVLTASDITNEGKSASFTVSLTNPSSGYKAEYYYPAAMADETSNPNYDALYKDQDGTLESLASKFDFAWGCADFDGVTLPSISLENILAILAINFKYESADNDITSTITNITLKAGSHTYDVSRSAAAGPIYVAILPTNGANIQITAAAGPIIYTKSLSDKTYAASNGYSVSWMMSRYGINLAAVTTNTTALNGDTITGALDTEHYPVKISIANNATVTLNGVTISGVNNSSYRWAGLNCEGNATIILKDGTTNTVKGFYESSPGIYVPQNYTLTIQGTGTLNANGRYGAGIGGGYLVNCGNIEIQGGTINASCSENAAAIGGGRDASCGNITISGGHITAASGWGAGIGSGYAYSETTSCGNISITGGTIIATGGPYCAGIGSGCNSNCGAITITSGVTSVTATKGSNAYNSIGKGWGNTASSCGTVTIGGIVFWQSNAYKNSGGDYLTRTTLVYPQVTDLSTITEDYTASFRETLTGTLGANVKISIADGHTVTLDGVSINASGTWTSGDYAGITCLGDATIILKDGSANTVKGFKVNYPGISVPAGKTLTIQGETAPGTGSLNASSNAASSDVISGAGIGGHSSTSCGNIEIQGGNITATCTGKWGAGIGGGGYNSSVACGYITISGGTVTANGGGFAAGIGSGIDGSCGAITITTGVTSVTANRGASSSYDCIGRGNAPGTCSNVTIGGVVYWNGSAYQNGGDTHIKQSTLTYEPTH